MYGSSDAWTLNKRCQREPRFVTVIYLDGDATVAPLVEGRWASGAVRPLFAGGLRSMLRWDAWPD
jgi:hypothetical protein